MADDGPSTSQKKKLPFKQTVLKRASSKVLESEVQDDDEDDSLSLFRRRNEMAPKLKEDQERRMQRKQKKMEEHRRREAEEAEREKQEQETMHRLAMDAFIRPGDVTAADNGAEESAASSIGITK